MLFCVKSESIGSSRVDPVFWCYCELLVPPTGQCNCTYVNRAADAALHGRIAPSATHSCPYSSVAELSGAGWALGHAKADTGTTAHVLRTAASESIKEAHKASICKQYQRTYVRMRALPASPVLQQTARQARSQICALLRSSLLALVDLACRLCYERFREPWLASYVNFLCPGTRCSSSC